MDELIEILQTYHDKVLKTDDERMGFISYMAEAFKRYEAVRRRYVKVIEAAKNGAPICAELAKRMKLNKEERVIMGQLTDEELEVLKTRYAKFSEMEELYNSNEEFRRFVDKSCKDYGLCKDICLLHKTVQDVGEYYINKKKEHENDICPCGLATDELPDDKAC